jgi:hypothetical protein
MRLDHVSYVASHDQISDVVNRIGSRIGTVFIDGGIHPKFGTRNFTAPLLNKQYIEVVCPLDHPATDVTPFGQVVKQKLEEGGGWLAWVISTENIIHFEKIIERESVLGKRVKPNGEELEWRQLGVLNLTSDPELPFFIQWISGEHPSVGNDAKASISKINIEGDSSKVIKLLADETSIFENLNFTNQKNQLSGINSIEFNFNGNTVEIF